MKRLFMLCLLVTSGAGAEDVWVIGNVPPAPGMQRVLGDSTCKAVLIQEQTIGRVPVVFESQSRYLQKEENTRTPIERVTTGSQLPDPLRSLSQTNLIMAKGCWTSERVLTDTYSGVKQYAGVTNVEYTYFLAKDAFITGVPLRVSANTNNISITVDGSFLPVPNIPIVIEVVDEIARKEIGSTTGTICSNKVVVFAMPLRNVSSETSGQVVSVHLMNCQGLSLLAHASYLDAYYGWTNSVSQLNSLLKTSKSPVLFSVYFRINLENGEIWN